MSTWRMGFVHKAFDILDHDGNCKVTLDELFSKYDATKHPDVISGKLTVDQAIQLFAGQWESNKPDGMITKQAFVAYYQNLSALIDSDIYFELLMRNAWRIPGDEGQCSNTANSHVLASDAKDRQSITELEPNSGTTYMQRQIQETIQMRTRDANIPSTTRQWRDIKRGLPRGTSMIKLTRQESPLAIAQLRPFHRRQMNLNGSLADSAQQEIKNNFFYFDETKSDIGHGQQRDEERNLREKAAQLIQSHFRGFRGRRFVACVRRKLAFDAKRKALEQENQSTRPKIHRTPLRSFHGF